MNILVINWQDIRNPLGGGAEVHLHEIFKRVAARGHQVTLLCSRFAGSASEETIDGIRVIRCGSRNTFNFHVPFQYIFKLRRMRFDVIVDDLNKIPFFTPLFVRRPLAGIIHHLFGKTIFSEVFFIPALYVAAAENLALPVYKHIPLAVVSESTKKEMLSHGYREKNLFLVPNCVDHLQYRAMEVEKQSGPVIGYLGRLKKYKSVEDLLFAFSIVLKEFPTVRLQVIGEGDARRNLETIARETKVAPSVDFLGHVTHEEKIQYLSQMKFVVNTSAKEGWGLTVIEANACGVPVIASDVPGLRDSVLDERTGLLYEYANVEQLAQKMLLLLRDDVLCSRLASEAMRWAKSFDWERSADAMLEMLQHAITTHPSGSRERS